MGYAEVGRVRQKQRTRDALVGAARDLIAEGVTPTVEGAAERAGVSRPTAYRYFASQAALLATAHPEIVTTTLLPATAPVDVAARLEIVVRRVTDMVVDTEPQQRTMLRLSLEPGLRQPGAPAPPGPGDRLARGSARATRGRARPRRDRRLAIAIRSAIGIESFVWLTDVAGLSKRSAAETMRWTARSLLEAASARFAPAPNTAWPVDPYGLKVQPMRTAGTCSAMPLRSRVRSATTGHVCPQFEISSALTRTSLAPAAAEMRAARVTAEPK